MYPQTIKYKLRNTQIFQIWISSGIEIFRAVKCLVVGYWFVG